MAGSPVKTFSCPACGGQVALHAAGHTVSAICEHCSTVIDTANENFRIIKKSRERTIETDIPIGAKGQLDGVQWEVIGYMEKKDLAYEAYWDEYLLFNPYFGFRFLVQADGHWNLARVIKQTVPMIGRNFEVKLEDEKFQLFDRGESSVQYVKGEFYWRVQKGDKDSYADYIAPPYMLSMEKNDGEMTLSVSEYLLPAKVEKAFGVSLKKREGIAANQPGPLRGSMKGMWLIGLIACVLAFIVQNHTGPGKLLANKIVHIDRIAPNATYSAYSTPVFNMPRGANVLVEGNVTPLKNNWVDIDLTLVNDAANDAYYATQSVEYYAGWDGGEHWTEGSPQGETYFSAVRRGNYRLVFQPTVGQMVPPGMDIQVVVRRNVSAWGNFWLAVLAILALPILVMVRNWHFEYRRWRNSDYAPAIYDLSSD